MPPYCAYFNHALKYAPSNQNICLAYLNLALKHALSNENIYLCPEICPSNRNICLCHCYLYNFMQDYTIRSKVISTPKILTIKVVGPTITRKIASPLAITDSPLKSTSKLLLDFNCFTVIPILWYVDINKILIELQALIRIFLNFAVGHWQCDHQCIVVWKVDIAKGAS